VRILSSILEVSPWEAYGQRYDNFKSEFHCSGNDFELIEIEPLIIRCNSPPSLFVICYSPFANINRIMVLPSLMFGIVASISLCHALPHNFQVVNKAYVARDTSDPACPSGYSCLSSTCPNNVICPTGMSCINFGGIMACISSDVDNAEVCALNQNTLAAVICGEQNGVCWYVLLSFYHGLLEGWLHLV
jgi:hypothetical protein